MKKLLFLALSMLIALPTMADDEVKNWNFENNEEGRCVVELNIPTEKDAKTVLQTIQRNLSKSFVSNNSGSTVTVTGSYSSASFKELIEENDSTVTYKLFKNTKNMFNPFAGNFSENLQCFVTATVKDNNVNIIFEDFTIVFRYLGYGAKEEIKSFEDRINQYNENIEKINNPSTKKKDRKKLIDEQEDINDELNRSQEELNKIIDMIKRGL